MLEKNSDFAPRADDKNSGPREDALYYWRFCDALSVVQAALLIVGEDPSVTQGYIANWAPKDRPTGFDAVETALINAIEGKRLPATVAEMEAVDEHDRHVADLDLHRTTILVEDLRVWLKSRGVTTGFFFPQPEGPGYLSSSHPCYSAKLAAAISAWLAVSENRDLKRGKSVKQVIETWLRQHANEFGLTKDDGNPNAQGIEEVAKIANWDTKGGAPKTPGNE
jgi:hypothetical protein